MSGFFNLQNYSSFRTNRGELKQEDGADQNSTPSSLGQSSDTTVLGRLDGRRAWSIVLGSFLAHLAVLGMLYAFGIFVVPLSMEFGVSRADVSLVGTIHIAFFYVGGVYSGPLADRFGVRPIMTIGASVWVLGCFLASLTNALWQQILSQGVMIGFGASFVYWPAIAVVPQWFDKYRGTAVGLAALGAGIGNLIFALGGQSIITALGWRNTLRVMGGVGGGLLFCSILLVKRRVPPRKGGGLFDVARRLIKLKSYRWFLLGTFLFQWGFFVPFVHLAAYARDLGVEPTLQGLAVAMLGVGSSVGRVAIGPVADKLGRLATFRVCMFAAAVTLATWPACQDIGSILTFAFFYAFFAGGFIAQSPVVAGDLWGVASLGGTFALMNVVMIPGGLACGPIAGLVYTTYGSYNAAIWGAAIFLFLSSCCLMFVRKEKDAAAVATPQITAQSSHPEIPATDEKTAQRTDDLTQPDTEPASSTSLVASNPAVEASNPLYEASNPLFEASNAETKGEV